MLAFLVSGGLSVDRKPRVVDALADAACLVWGGPLHSWSVGLNLHSVASISLSSFFCMWFPFGHLSLPIQIFGIWTLTGSGRVDFGPAVLRKNLRNY